MSALTDKDIEELRFKNFNNSPIFDLYANTLKEMAREEMDSDECIICGKNIPIDMTQIMVPLGDYKYAHSCCSHEGTKALTDYIKDHREGTK